MSSLPPVQHCAGLTLQSVLLSAVVASIFFFFRVTLKVCTLIVNATSFILAPPPPSVLTQGKVWLHTYWYIISACTRLSCSSSIFEVAWWSTSVMKPAVATNFSRSPFLLFAKSSTTRSCQALFLWQCPPTFFNSFSKFIKQAYVSAIDDRADDP